MSDLIEVKEYRNVPIKIYRDLSPTNPRNFDNLGIMACSWGKRKLGDREINRKDYLNWGEVKTDIVNNNNVAEIYPLHAYEHGLTRIKIGSFGGRLPQGHVRFDSAKVGFIYTTQERVNEMGVDNDRVGQILRREVDIYDNYLSGQVYGFVVDDTGEGRWGFYGGNHEDSGLMEEARRLVDDHVERRRKQRQRKLRALIDNDVPLQKREKAMARI